MGEQNLRRSRRHSPSRGVPQALGKKPSPDPLNRGGRCCLRGGPLGSTPLIIAIPTHWAGLRTTNIQLYLYIQQNSGLQCEWEGLFEH